jgi:[FeFe] hydrogenase H-cluster maturation GTPase HydF
LNTLNDTPTSERVHIAVFGKRNAGKSSLINAITGQSLSIVSEIAGTTTDPVYKSMELLPMGPVVLIDTPGIDDDGELGSMRIEKTNEVLRKTDIALLVVDAVSGVSYEDENLLKIFKKQDIPFIVILNKCDLLLYQEKIGENSLYVSAEKGINIFELKEKIAHIDIKRADKTPFLEDLVDVNNIVVLVMPQGAAAPKSRLIFPEQQAVRAIIDKDAICVCIKDPWQIPSCLKSLRRQPKLVVTDSQVFKEVAELLPENIKLTSFSILMARYKGVLKYAVDGIKSIENLVEGDSVLISEGCTHHRQCDDIGTVKIPNWLSVYTGKEFNFEFTSGREFPSDLSKYKLIVHCGGCMLNDAEVIYRYLTAARNNVPITNYGTLVAFLHGILDRCLEPLNPPPTEPREYKFNSKKRFISGKWTDI